MLTELKQKAEERVGASIDGKYRLEKVLGVGGMGAVYAARHRFTDRKVALKILHARLARGANAKRFLQEAKAAAAIQHHGLADVLDAGKAPDGTLYVAFELLKGKDFGALIKAKVVNARVAVEVALHVLEALDVVHRNGFVHRDIKPANIFVVGDVKDQFRAKLLDFGVVRRVSSNRAPTTRSVTRAGAVVGTPYYMSPEQMCGEPVDGRADLWALGIVMYYALTSKLPFRQKNYLHLLSEMMKKGPPPLRDLNPHIPAELAMAIERALAPSIEDRYTTAQDMMMALQIGRDFETPPQKTDVLRIEVVSSTSDALPTRTSPGLMSPGPRWESALEAIDDEADALEAARREVPGPTARPSSGGLLSWLRKKK